MVGLNDEVGGFSLPGDPAYYTMGELIEMMEEPNRSACFRILKDNRDLFKQAPGSTHNHQAWEGGYWDHVVEVMNFCVLLYRAFRPTGRLSQLADDEQFKLSDGLLVLFLHDIEKPWRCRLVDGHPVKDGAGNLVVNPEFESKAVRKAFAQDKIREYGVHLTDQQKNALRYVEGIRDADYTPGARLMTPLAVLCHTCDLWSARLCYDAPLRDGDAWSGATRVAKRS